MNETNCLIEDLRAFSGRVPQILLVAYRVQWHLQKHGLLSTIRRIPAVLSRQALRSLGFERTKPSNQVQVLPDEVLHLRPGELVEVKSWDEIRKTLDSTGRNRGLSFMAEMQEYCGRKLRVYKRVERMRVENTVLEVRRVSNTVLLEGAVCQGSGLRCDRSCSYFWKEAWLKRVDGGQAS
jgi:hypothetical protein